MQILQSYKSAVQTIAAQCPYYGGFSVYRARTLFRLFNDTLYFDDTEICAKPYRSSEAENESINSAEDYQFTCYPNPTDGILKINWLPCIYNEPLHFNIYDLTGRLIVAKALDCAMSTVQFELYDTISGIYRLEIKSSNITLLNKSIAVIK